MADEAADPPLIEGLEIRGLLGRGVTSRVYLATQSRFARPVAVKVLDTPAGARGPLELLADEARFTALLSSHPNILTLYDAGVTDEGATFLVTEYLPAGSLAQRLRSEGPLAEAEVLAIGIQLAGALESSHLHGVVHGDVKPDNVLVGRTGEPQLADFGVAVMLSRSAVAAQALITPLHAAPELFTGAPASVSGDLYSLGSTLTELLCGHSPVGSREDPPAAIVSRVERGERITCGSDDADPELLALLESMTDADPTRRPDSAEAVGRRLAELEGRREGPVRQMLVIDDLMAGVPASGEPVAAAGAATTVPPPVALPADGAAGTREPVVARGRRRGLLAGAGLAVVALAVATVLLWPDGEDPAEVLAGGDAAPEPQSDPPEGTADGSGGGGDRVPEEVPEGTLGGIQPGIDFAVGGQDTSAELAELLSEERLILGTPVEPEPHDFYGRVLHTLPASFHYLAYNKFEPNVCTRMMSREITVTGLWERGAIWPGGGLLAAVAETVDEESAYELATVLSVEFGAEGDDCRGFGAINVIDYDDYAVDHREVEDMLPAGVDYNVWHGLDSEVGSHVWGETVRLVMQVDNHVLDVSLATDAPLASGNLEVVGKLAEQVRARLLAAD